MYIMLCASLMLHPINTSLESTLYVPSALQWRHDEPDGVSSHRRRHFVLNCMFRRRSKKASKLRVTGFCEGISPVSGEFPSQRPVTRKIFPCDDVIMVERLLYSISQEICTRFCCALLCCGYAIVHNEFTWSIYPYSSGLLCWHWGNR